MTRKQELFLINKGLEALLNEVIKTPKKEKKEKPTQKRMSKAARKALSLRMKKMWEKKRKTAQK